MHVCYLEHCGRKAARNCLFLLQRISKAFCVASSSQGYSFSCKQESARAHTHVQNSKGNQVDGKPQLQRLQCERVQKHTEFNLGEAKSIGKREVIERTKQKLCGCFRSAHPHTA